VHRDPREVHREPKEVHRDTREVHRDPREVHRDPREVRPLDARPKPRPRAPVALDARSGKPSIQQPKPVVRGVAHPVRKTEAPVSIPRIQAPKAVPKTREDNFIARPVIGSSDPRRPKEEQKAPVRRTQPATAVHKPVSREEEEDRRVAEIFQRSLLDAQAEEDARLAEMLANEASEGDFTSADAELARKLAAEEEAAIFDQYS
jgi:hypothetical protein